MDVTLLSDEAFDTIGKQWAALEDANPGQEALFAGWRFCKAVRTAIRPDTPAVVLSARVDDQLVGVWPLALRNDGLAHVLYPYGMPIPQYANILTDKSVDARTAAKAFLQYLRENDVADALELPHAMASSGLCDADQDIDIKDAEENAIMTPMIDCRRWRKDWGGEPALGKRYAKEMRRKRRRLEEIGPVKTHLSYDVETRVRAVEVGLEWKHVWLDKNNMTSVALKSPLTRDLLLALARDVNSNMLVWVTTAGDEMVACELGFGNADQYFAYMGAFDPAHDRIGPGAVQMCDTLSLLGEMGVQYYDLMQPVVGYKTKWAHVARPVFRYSEAYTVRGSMVSMIKSDAVRELARSAWHTMPKAVRDPIANKLAG